MVSRLFHLLRARARRSRQEFFWEVMQPSDATLLLDLGGGSGLLPSVLDSQKHPLMITDIKIENLRSAREKFARVTLVAADGMRMPFADQSIGCVFCNSVIEHVDEPAQLANEIARIGRSYFVQTPNRGFPVETHSFIPIPLYHFFPMPVQKLLCKVFRSSYDYVSSVTYLSESELRRLFPDATLHKETFLGLTKSFYLYRHAGGEE